MIGSNSVTITKHVLIFHNIYLIFLNLGYKKYFDLLQEPRDCLQTALSIAIFFRVWSSTEQF